MKKRIISAALAATTMLGMAAAPAQSVIPALQTAITASAAEDITESDLVVDLVYYDYSGNRVVLDTLSPTLGSIKTEKYDIDSTVIKDLGFEVTLPKLPKDKQATYSIGGTLSIDGLGCGVSGYGKINVDNPVDAVLWEDIFAKKKYTYDHVEYELSFDSLTVTDYPETTPLKDAVVKVANKTYTGKALNPAPTVTLDGKTLKKGTDYTVSYKNNKNCGKATVTVTGKGSYTGSKSKAFIIKPAKVTSKKLTSPKSKTVKLTWTKAKGGVTGYQIKLGLNKKMTSGKKVVSVKKASATAKTIKGLRSKKVYYVKVRAYKQVGDKKYVGKWSAIKSVKCK